MWGSFFTINTLIRKEVAQRNEFPLGDEGFAGPLLTVDGREVSGDCGVLTAPARDLASRFA